MVSRKIYTEPCLCSRWHERSYEFLLHILSDLSVYPYLLSVILSMCFECFFYLIIFPQFEKKS